MENLSDVTFVIPLKIDSNDRLFNIELIIDYLRKNFETKIIIGEDGNKLSKKIIDKCDKIYKYPNKFFHRTKILNFLYKQAKTNIICNYDADVLFHPSQYLDSVNNIRNDNFDVCYPYSGKFMDIKKQYHMQIKNSLDISFLDKCGHHIRHHSSLGGAYFFKSELLYKGIMENENFKSWGCEDWERYHRYNILGFKINRIDGNLYHLNHYRDSSCHIKSTGCLDGKKELDYILTLNKEGILEYMSNWECMKK